MISAGSFPGSQSLGPLGKGGETHFLQVGHSRRVASFVLQPMHLVIVGGRWEGGKAGENEEDEVKKRKNRKMKQGHSDRGLFIGRRISRMHLGRSHGFCAISWAIAALED